MAASATSSVSVARQINALIGAQAAARASYSRAAQLAAASRIAAMTEAQWYSDEAVADLAAAIAVQLAGAQTETAAVTDAYLARLTSLMVGKNIQPVGAASVAALRGLPSPQVYQRLGETYRYQRSIGVDHGEAVRLTTERAEVMTDADTTLAMRVQSRKFMTRRGVQKYRRIIRPELSKGGTCGLCIAAADRIYYRSKLLPVHGRCHCGIAPVIGDHDPGHSLNAADLDALYGAAGGSTRRQDLARVRITEHHHGELGPLLARAGEAFRGPEDLPHAD